MNRIIIKKHLHDQNLSKKESGLCCMSSPLPATSEALLTTTYQDSKNFISALTILSVVFLTRIQVETGIKSAAISEDIKIKVIFA